jgi:hypothetical protein
MTTIQDVDIRLVLGEMTSTAGKMYWWKGGGDTGHTLEEAVGLYASVPEGEVALTADDIPTEGEIIEWWEWYQLDLATTPHVPTAEEEATSLRERVATLEELILLLYEIQ